jgi:hypothetical protein
MFPIPPTSSFLLRLRLRSGTILFMNPLHFSKFFLKINLNIFIFYVKSIIFYHFLNKKITINKNFHLFYIKHSYFFFFLISTHLLQYFSTSHLILFPNIALIVLNPTNNGRSVFSAMTDRICLLLVELIFVL